MEDIIIKILRVWFLFSEQGIVERYHMTLGELQLLYSSPVYISKAEGGGIERHTPLHIVSEL